MRTVGELRAALEGVPDDAEWLVCVDVGDGDAKVFVDPGETRELTVQRPGEPGWPFAVGDEAPPAMAYLMVGEWTS